MINKTISHYRILEKLGGGGMGVVYKATDTSLDRPVALKFLLNYLDTPEHEKRFILEAKTASALDHPNICTIYEIDKSPDEEMFIAMAFYDGETLKKTVSRGPLSVNEAVDYCLQTARGLAKAHEYGIVHRDIKPANLMLTKDRLIKILDFGLAKFTRYGGLTKTGIALGTIAYMSPQQTLGQEIDARADIWSLGVLLYELLTGRLPFLGNTEWETIHQIRTSDPLPIGQFRPDLSSQFQNVISRALEKDPNHRFQTIQEFVSELQAPDRSYALTKSFLEIAPDQAATQTVMTEKRNITIAACQLSGHADLIEQLSPDEAASFLDQIKQMATGIVQRFGGLLNQFSESGFIFLFGIPVAHEDHHLRAIRAILKLHEALPEIAQRFEPKIGQSIRFQSGIATGPVVAELLNKDRKYRISGTAAQLATTLASFAEEDEAIVTSECQRLIAPYFETEARPPITLKGKSKLSPYRVLKESGMQTRLEASERAGFTPFTGREKELNDLLRGHEEMLQQGEGRLATIMGEAGIGKSRLLFEFRRKLDHEKISIVQGRCHAYRKELAYTPFMEALGNLLFPEDISVSPDWKLAAKRIEEIDTALLDFLPLYLHLLSLPSDEHSLPKHLQGDDLRVAIQDALTAIFVVSASKKPLILFLEDWNWADQASDEVLRQLMGMLPSSRIFLIVTHRPGIALSENSAVTQTPIRLLPFDSNASLSLLKAILKVDKFPEDWGRSIVEHTGSNPFFMEELCQTLQEEAKIWVEDGTAFVLGNWEEARMPHTIEAVIRSRLDHLDSQSLDLLRVASVMSREFTRSILKLAIGEQKFSLRALENLKEIGIIQQTRLLPEATYKFKHMLTQQVVYESLLPHQRKVLHGLVGRAMEELYPDRKDEIVDTLAHHFGEAEVWDKAVSYGRASAQRASELSQFSQALKQLEQTQSWLSNLPKDAERNRIKIEILLTQERLCETMGLRERQQRIIEELKDLVESVGNRAKIAEVLGRQGDLYTLLGKYEEAEEAFRTSLQISKELGDKAAERKVVRSFGFLRWRQEKYEEAVEWNEKALAMDRQAGEMLELAGDLTNLGNVLRHMKKPEQALEYLNEAEQIYEQHKEGVQEPSTFMIGTIYSELGDTDKALEYYQKALESTKKRRLIIYEGFMLSAIANIYWQRGEEEKSLHVHREVLELNRRINYADGLAQSLRIVGEILCSFGREFEAQPYLREGADLFCQLGDPMKEATVRNSLASAYEKEKNWTAAVECIRRARELYRSSGEEKEEMNALIRMCRLMRAAGDDLSQIRKHYEEALAIAEKLGDWQQQGAIANSMGIMEWERGEYQNAARYYEKALQIFESNQDRVHQGLILNSLGSTWGRLGKYQEALKVLQEAIQVNNKTAQLLLLAHSHALLGDTWKLLEELDNAAESYQNSLIIRREIGDRKGEGWMLYQLARIYAARNEKQKAEEFAKLASEISEECSDAELKQACIQLTKF